MRFLNKKTKVARRNGSRRRIRMIVGGKFEGIPSGTNDFANYYLKKYATTTLKDKSPIIESDVLVPEGSVLWVIDMQNDFIDIPMQGLKGPPVPDLGNIGSFAVSEGSAVIDSLIEFMKTNSKNFNKIVFTRDWHPENHCSFSKDQIGTFPPHCIWNSLGAAFNDQIKGTITQKDRTFTCFERPADILFKGHHEDTDSFSGVTWNGEDYPFKNRQLTTCCQTIDTCKGKTGARPLNPEHISKSLELDIGCSSGVDCFESDYTLPSPSGSGEIFVVGLAGEFCVKDTAIMLKKNFPSVKVNVVQDLTRYVFVPVFLPFQRYPLVNADKAEPCQFGELLMKGEWMDNNNSLNVLSNGVFDTTDNQKPLSQYLFEYNPGDKTKTRRLETSELDQYKEQELKFDDPPLWHFASDHRSLLKDYMQFDVKLLMSKDEQPSPTPVPDNLPTTAPVKVTDSIKSVPSYLKPTASSTKKKDLTAKDFKSQLYENRTGKKPSQII
jgi:nicotinamidase-related amidase